MMHTKLNSLMLTKSMGPMSIKEDGQWELTNETPTIDTETHHILMSTTPVAGNKMGRQSLSTGTTLCNKTG